MSQAASNEKGDRFLPLRSPYEIFVFYTMPMYHKSHKMSCSVLSKRPARVGLTFTMSGSWRLKRKKIQLSLLLLGVLATDSFFMGMMLDLLQPGGRKI
ncbi:hypothetical protein [Calothrix sp. NIES-2098]|uniref:hypothetical protein n=1 Tax=Calothrix sp. NIES-2098 TaxID=1954171 RepID=UPI0030D6F660